MLESFINIINKNKGLSEQESYKCLMTIFTGECPKQQVVKLLTRLSEKGESVEELIGFAKAMREKMTEVSLSKEAIDICGTGGTGKDRFNVSTSISFVLAAAGIPVAKHGNRGSKKQNGSFDFLEGLDIGFDLSVPEIVDVFNRTNLCFLYARNHHLAMKHVALARKEIGKRTIFNMIGPLCNPAKVKYQIIGTISDSLANKLAQTIRALGIKRAFVISGGNKIDELSIEGKSIIYDVSSHDIKKLQIDPYALNCAAKGQNITLGNAISNAKLFKEVFSERIIDHDVMRMVLLNAGAAIYCFGRSNSIEQGMELAKEQIATGKAWQKYLEYKELVPLK